MLENNNSPAGPQFVAGSAFSAVFKFDDEDYLASVPNGGGYQHQYTRGVDPGQTGPEPGDVEPTNPPDGVGLVEIRFDGDNNGIVETTFRRTSSGDGAPGSVGRVSRADNLLPGVDWFKWIGSALSKDVSILGLPPDPDPVNDPNYPGSGWLDIWPDGDDVNPPANADMTAIQTTLFGLGGLGMLIGVGGGGTFFGDPGGIVTSFSVSSTRPPINQIGFDGDNDMDGTDFLVWQRGESPIPLSSWDLNTWGMSFGIVGSPVTAASSAVPEPSCFILLLATFAFALQCRQP